MIVTLTVLITVAVYLVLAVMSFINGGLSKKTVVFSILMFLGMFWALEMLMLDGGSEESFIWISRFNYVVVISIYYTIMMFGLNFLKLTRKQWLLILLITALPLLCVYVYAVLGSGALIVSYLDMANAPAKVIVEFAPAGTIGVTLPALAYGMTGLAAIIRARKQSTTEYGKKLIGGLLLGFALFFSFNVVFNLVLGNLHEAHFIGPTSILLACVPFYRAVVKHGDDEL